MAVKNTKEVAETETVMQAKTPKKYSVEQLQGNCRKLFGVSTSTFVGATHKMTGKYTVEEMKAHIEAWKKKGVK